MRAIGIDLGGTSIKGALVHHAYGIVATAALGTETDKGPDHVLGQIESVARKLLRRTRNIVGLGIGAPGTIDPERARLIQPPNIPGWGDVDLKSILKSRLGQKLQVVVENDANAAAMGSLRYGAGRPYDHFIMVTLGTGVGGAIIFNKKLFRGANGAAGEIGHMTVKYDGPKDKAGVHGAIEAYIGQRFLTAHARDQLSNFPDSLLHVAPGLQRLTPQLIAEAAIEGDAGAAHILQWAGHKLGCVLGSCVNLLDIRTIIVGGGISAAGDLILEPARAAILSYIKPGMHEDVAVLREILGNEAGVLGAASLVFEEHYASSRGTG